MVDCTEPARQIRCDYRLLANLSVALRMAEQPQIHRIIQLPAREEISATDQSSD